MTILSDLTATKARKPTQGYILYKTAQKRLFLRVTAAGARKWDVLYRVAGKRERITLGSIATVSYAQAVTKAQEIAEQAREGRSAKNHQQLDIKTVAELVDLYDERHLQKLKAPETTRSRLKRWVVKHLGNKSLATIKTADFLRLSDTIEKTGAQSEHTRILKLCHQLFAFAVDRHIVTDNPVPKIKQTVKARSRYLSVNEIVTLWRDADSVNTRHCPFKQTRHVVAWKMLVLTAQRIDTVLTCERKELDLDAGVWTIPAHKMKGRTAQDQAHIVHLSPYLVEALRDVLASHKNKFVFHSVTDTAMPANKRWFTTQHSAWLKKLGIAHAVVHDYRRTFATVLAELNIDIFIAEKVLAHKMTGVLAVYNVAEYLNKRQEAVELFSRLLVGNIKTSNVVRLRANK